MDTYIRQVGLDPVLVRKIATYAIFILIGLCIVFSAKEIITGHFFFHKFGLFFRNLGTGVGSMVEGVGEGVGNVFGGIGRGMGGVIKGIRCQKYKDLQLEKEIEKIKKGK